MAKKKPIDLGPLDTAAPLVAAIFDPVNRPAHYNNHPSGIECIEVIRHFNFNLGNAIKYIWRAESGYAESPVEDLQKAAWYLSDEIKRRSGA